MMRFWYFTARAMTITKAPQPKKQGFLVSSTTYSTGHSNEKTFFQVTSTEAKVRSIIGEHTGTEFDTFEINIVNQVEISETEFNNLRNKKPVITKKDVSGI